MTGAADGLCAVKLVVVGVTGGTFGEVVEGADGVGTGGVDDFIVSSSSRGGGVADGVSLEGVLEGVVVSGVLGEMLGVEAGSTVVSWGLLSGVRNGEFEGVSSMAFMLTLCFNHPGSSAFLQAISTTSQDARIIR